MARSKEVDAWMARYDNPMKPVVERVRAIVLAADARMSECIKWQAPTFVYEGNLASFFPKSKTHASLMFHTGAKIPGNHPRLEGEGETGRVLKVASVAEANVAKRDIERIVRAWCDSRDGAPKKSTQPKRVAKPVSKQTKPRSKPSGDVLDVYRALVATLPGVALKGASMPYTSVNGHMFSFLAKSGELALRLPPKDRAAFMKAHRTSLCEQHGTVLEEYVVVPSRLLRQPSKLEASFAVSFGYVRGLKPKATKRAK